MKDFQAPIQRGYKFDGFEYLSEAWKIVRSDVGTYIGVNVLFVIIEIVLQQIPYVSSFSSFISVPMWAGFLIYTHNRQRGEGKLGDFFEGFRYALPLGLYMLVYLAIVVGPFIGVIVVAGVMDIGGLLEGGDQSRIYEFISELGGAMIVLAILWVLVAIYITISYSLTVQLIVLGQMNFWQAMETSRKTVAKQFFSYLGFYIALVFIAIIFFVVTLVIGAVLLAYPIAYALMYVMYDRIYPNLVSATDDIDEFGSIESDVNTESQEDRTED